MLMNFFDTKTPMRMMATMIVAGIVDSMTASELEKSAETFADRGEESKAGQLNTDNFCTFGRDVKQQRQRLLPCDQPLQMRCSESTSNA